MTSRIVISNASRLIALEQTGQLALLEQLFGSIVVPPGRKRGIAVGYFAVVDY